MSVKWLMAAIPALALAQTRLSLTDAINQALTANQLISAAAERVTVAEGMRRQADLLPNPRLVLQSENTRLFSPPPFVFWRDTDNFVYLQNTFETWGKRARRTELAQQAVDRAGLERELVRRQIAGGVAQGYWAAAGSRRLYSLFQENQRTFAQIIVYHESRVKEGAMAEADLLRVRLEADRLAIATNIAALEADRTRVQLLRVMGQTVFPELEFTEPVEKPDLDLPAMDVAGALERRPEARLARQAIQQAGAALRLQQVAGKPNVDAVFGYKRTAALDTLLGGVQLDLPLFNRNQGNVFAATAGIRAAERDRAAVEALIRAEVQAAWHDYEIRFRQIAISLQPLLEKARETARIANAAYREAGVDLLRLLDAERVRIEAEAQYYRYLVELRQSRVALDIAMGLEPR